MRSGGRGRTRLRLGGPGLLEPPSPRKRLLLPRMHLLPQLLLALAVAVALYILWGAWRRGAEDLPPRVRTVGTPATRLFALGRRGLCGGTLDTTAAGAPGLCRWSRCFWPRERGLGPLKKRSLGDRKI